MKAAIAAPAKAPVSEPVGGCPIAPSTIAVPVFSLPLRIQRKCACGGECPDCRRKRADDLPALQTKLAVNRPGDALEQEADRLADLVMRPEPALPAQESRQQSGERRPASSSTPISAAELLSAPGPSRAAPQAIEHPGETGSVPALQRKCACGGGGEPCPKCEEETDAKAQREAAPGAGEPVVAGLEVHPRSLGAGRPLDLAARTFMESRFGAEFSHVRIHEGARATSAARALNALAYTVGSDIVFGQGRYAPATT